jgi:hypothetical protein
MNITSTVRGCGVSLRSWGGGARDMNCGDWDGRRGHVVWCNECGWRTAETRRARVAVEDLTATQELPVVTMAEMLVEGGR